MNALDFTLGFIYGVIMISVVRELFSHLRIMRDGKMVQADDFWHGVIIGFLISAIVLPCLLSSDMNNSYIDENNTKTLQTKEAEK